MIHPARSGEFELGSRNNQSNEESTTKQRSDSRAFTSEPIYEAYRREQLEGHIRSRLVFLLSTFLAFSAITAIAFLQYDEFIAFINDRHDYIERTKLFCNQIEFSNIDLVSTPIATFLVLLYILIYKRRVFLRTKFRYRNIGVPMLVSCWNKTDRMFSAFAYGLIAFNVFGIVKDSLNGTNSLKSISNVQDPSGLLALLYRVFQMFLVGIRYYPVLVAYRVNTFLISATCVVYLWIDFVENIYQYGKCDSISSESSNSIAETTRRLGYYITYKVLSAVPLSIFSSFIIITLTYKAFINLVDFILRYRSPKTHAILKYKSRDTVFCMIANVDDDHEIFYSKCDFDYVIQLFEKKGSEWEGNNEPEDKETEKKQQTKEKKTKVKVFKYVTIKPMRDPLPLKYVRKFVYDPDTTFRFTSRYCNTLMVAVVALYYVFLYWSYTISMNVSLLVNFLPDFLDTGTLSINVGQFLCDYVPGACLPALVEAGPISIPLPKKFIKLFPGFKSWILAVFVVPLFASLLVCLIQVFFLVRETKTHLLEMYQGKCEFVKKAKNIPKESIASSSFHFGGYMVGYLIWGYFIIYFTGVIVGIVIIVIRLFIGDAMFGQILLRLVPAITVVVVKMLINKIATNYWFLDRKSKILALNNFRAFNVFLYFNFYFDCFMGLISAVIRLIQSMIIAIFMMPRVSYSFMGRHWERQDAGYSCYSGFLHMEAMHTNPIIICFCSILYYKDLSEHLRRYRKQRRMLASNGEFAGADVKVQMNEFTGRLCEDDFGLAAAHPNGGGASNGGFDDSISARKQLIRREYKTQVVIRWHLFAIMSMNKDLIKYRKIKKVKREKREKEGVLGKIKKRVQSLCCRKKEDEFQVSSL